MTDNLIGCAAILLFIVVFAYVNISKAKIGWSFVNNNTKEKLK